jgi:hypothetical protein
MTTSGRRGLLGLSVGLSLLWALGARASQEQARPAPAAPAPVPITVRVVDGDRFVPGLTLADFEIEEAGLKVSPLALYQVRKDRIERQEGGTGRPPDVSRKIFLLFRMTEYHNKIPEALGYLFDTELLPTDTLEIQTPAGEYGLTRAALLDKPRATLTRELTALLRKDIFKGGMAYNNALRDLKRVIRQLSGAGRAGLGDTEGEVDDGTSLEQQLIQYREHLEEMETFRVVDEAGLVRFARRLKGQSGQKLVFFVYQREFRPEISSQTLDRLTMANQERPDILAALQTLFPMYSRPMPADRETVAQAFADSGMDLHFLFMNRQPERISGITMREQSEDVFQALSGAAEATGGTTDTSQNPAASLAKALKAAESAYILFFTPATAAPRGTFIPLRVRVKGRAYRVAHRLGYLT